LKPRSCHGPVVCHPRRRPVCPELRAALGGAVLGAVTLQFLLGIATLLHGVPVSLGGMHQAGAVILLGSALMLAHAQHR